MKIFILSLLLMTVACNEKKETASAEATKAPVAQTNGILPGDLPEEDCDDKAKKTVEITEESISLNNADTGCSLDEMEGLQK